MGVDNGGSAYQQDLEHELEEARNKIEELEADRDRLAMTLEQIARGGHENGDVAWAALAHKEATS